MPPRTSVAGEILDGVGRVRRLALVVALALTVSAAASASAWDWGRPDACPSSSEVVESSLAQALAGLGTRASIYSFVDQAGKVVRVAGQEITIVAATIL